MTRLAGYPAWFDILSGAIILWYQNGVINMSAFSAKKNQPTKVDTSGDLSYDLLNSNGGNAKFLQSGSSLAAPRSVEIIHDIKPLGQPGTDRHLIKSVVVVLDGLGRPRIHTMTFSCSIPRSDANYLEAFTFQKNVVLDLLCSDSGFGEIFLQGGIPAPSLTVAT